MRSWLYVPQGESTCGGKKKGRRRKHSRGQSRASLEEIRRHLVLLLLLLLATQIPEIDPRQTRASSSLWIVVAFLFWPGFRHVSSLLEKRSTSRSLLTFLFFHKLEKRDELPRSILLYTLGLHFVGNFSSRITSSASFTKRTTQILFYL